MRAPLLSSNAKKNALLVLGALAFAFLAAEIFLRIFDPVRPPDRVEFEVDRETYWRVRPNQSDMRPPATNVNAQGFRATRDVGEKQPGQDRVFVLGASYTWGQGVPDEQTFSAQLEALSNGRFEVINGATPGWGVFQYEARLRQRVDDLDPDIVVVTVNPLHILRQPYASKEEEEAFLRQSALRNNVRRISKLVTVSVRLMERFRLMAQNRDIGNAQPMNQGGGVAPAVYERLLTRDTERLSGMMELAHQRGIDFVLLAWPQDIPNNQAFLATMESLADERGVTYIDLSSVLERYQPEEYTLQNNDHPSEFGHRIVAEELWRVLSESPTP